MKKRLFAALCCLCLLLFSCARENADYLAPFTGDFSARVRGTFRGMAFEAELTADTSPEGARAVTLTFYAPESLAGTTVAAAPDGEILLSAGGVSVSGGAAGFRPLLELFPASGEITEVRLTENGLTRVCGKGFSVDFCADGTPAAAENEAAAVTVTSFVKE